MEHNLQFLNYETANQYQEMMDHNFLWPDWEPTAEFIEDGIIVPVEAFYDEDGLYRYRGGVLDTEGDFVKSSGLYKGLDGKNKFLSMVECPNVDLDDCVYIDEEVVYYGYFIYHWGHFLFESTNRLWYYLQENCKARGIRLAGVYNGKKPDGNFELFHNLLGIEQNDLILLDRPTRFKRVIVPKASCVLGGTPNFYYSEEFLAPFNKIMDSVPARPGRKVYLTRTNLQEGNTIGEEEIENNFRRNGFDIIAPENESLTTMVSILKEAEVVAGLSGSNTHNLLFSGSKSKTIILNRMQHTNYTQEMVHQARNIQAVYIDVYSTFLPVTHGNGPFLVSVNDHLFNFQVSVGMVPYHYSAYLSNDSITRFLQKWSTVYHNEPSANLYFNNIQEEFINKTYSFFVKNERGLKQKEISKKISLFLWIHKLGLKKIYEIINTDKNSLSDLNVIRYSYFFDEQWYRKKYMASTKDIEPAAHYLYHGYKDGNDPSPRFSTEGYFRLYIDILEGGINPLWHYEKHGKFEGRQIVQCSKRNLKKDG